MQRDEYHTKNSWIQWWRLMQRRVVQNKKFSRTVVISRLDTRYNADIELSKKGIRMQEIGSRYSEQVQ